MKDLSLEEAGRWMDAAPQFVQDAVASPSTQQIIEQLGKQYELHIDVIDLLMKLTSYMLLGYMGPEEFLKELRAIGVPDQQARQIIGDINQKIFVPLREKMRSGGATTSQPPKPVVPPTTARPIARTPLPPTSAQPPHYFHLENKLPPPPPRQGSQTPATTPPEATKGTATPPSGLAGALKQVLHKENQAPLLQKPTNDEKLLEDHEEPHLNIGVSGKVQGASLPGTQPPIPVPLKPSTLPLKPPPAPSAPRAPSPPLPISRYSNDPYREPIDEK